MLFGTRTTGYTQFMIRMARFYGNDKMEFIDNQQAEGNFFNLLDAGMAFFFKHLSLSGKITGIMREEHLEVPVAALREGLINALCHRQYEKYNLTIGIAIYDDRIEIESPGKFPPQITPENIKKPHRSYPYNPVIADVLFKTTFLESWGSGARRIITACKEQNVAEPVWSDDGGFVVINFKRPSYSATNDTINDTINGTLNGTLNSLLLELEKKPNSTYEELISALGISRRSIARCIKEAVESEYLIREGSKKNGIWKITELGRQKIRK